MTPVASAISTAGLSKEFGSLRVVDGIDLDVPAGSVYGFLGPNGSGKTTTIRMLLGLVSPSGGSMEVLGRANPVDALHRVGCLVEGPAFHGHLSGVANLARIDAVDPLSDARTTKARLGKALDRVGLSAAAGKTFRRYSLGMRQRLAIAAALLSERDLLVLDEPTNGLDPQGTREVRHLIGDLASDGTTVLVSSHLLSEIEQVCTQLGVISAGKLVAQGTPEEIASGQRAEVILKTPDGEAAVRVLNGLGLAAQTTGPDAVRAQFPDNQQPLAAEEIVARLVGASVPVRGFELRRPTLEDVFVELTGEGFDVAH